MKDAENHQMLLANAYMQVAEKNKAERFINPLINNVETI